MIHYRLQVHHHRLLHLERYLTLSGRRDEELRIQGSPHICTYWLMLPPVQIVFFFFVELCEDCLEYRSIFFCILPPDLEKICYMTVDFNK